MATAIVTGSSMGIGKDIAFCLAESRYDLILVARSESILRSVSAEIERTFKVKCDYFTSDLSCPGAAEELYKKINSKYKKVDVLVNNAGGGTFDEFLSMDLKEINKAINLNLIALTELTYLFSKDMVKHGHGHVLNISSITAFVPGPYMAIYYASKAFVLSISQSIATELKGTGVSVTAFCPGPVATTFFNERNLKNLKNRIYFKYNPLIWLNESNTVAKLAVNAMFKRKVIEFDGLGRYLGILVLESLPRFLVRNIMAFINKKV